jgi:hypothetical protein
MREGGSMTRKLMIFLAVTALVICASIAFFMMGDTAEEVVHESAQIIHERTEEDVISRNPMEKLFYTMPNFRHYNKDEVSFEELFWNDEVLGGSLLYPLEFDGRYISNNLANDLKEQWDSKGEYSGYFIFRNL